MIFMKYSEKISFITFFPFFLMLLDYTRRCDANLQLVNLMRTCHPVILIKRKFDDDAEDDDDVLVS